MEEQKPLLVNDMDPAPGQATQVPIPGTSKSIDDLIKNDGNWKLHLSKQRDSIFFKLPLEVRLLIYRELLPLAFHASSSPERLTLMFMSMDARHALGGLDFVLARLRHLAMIRHFARIRNALKVLLGPHHFRRYLPSCSKIHPEILRTCRAIFAEAIPMLYREKVVTIFARSGRKEEAPKFSVDGIEPDEISHLQPILRYVHHLRIIIVDIVFRGGSEDDFRHKLDCIFFFLQKIPQLDCLLVRLGVCCPGVDSSNPQPGGYGASQRRMARNTVECVLGRLHNIRKVGVMESMKSAFCIKKSLDLVRLETLSWGEDLAKRMMGPADKGSPDLA